MSSGREISKSEKEKQKYIQEKCQTMLNDMLRDDDNKYCVDCDAKGPRWASWNLGIFLCIRCAGIHRNLGVHISRVKSVNLDTWTPEQVVTMQQMGNSRARAVYEANLPDSFRRPQTDLALENFIRAKYETNKYIAQEWVKPPPPKVNWDAEVEESLKKKKDKKPVQNDIGPLPTAIPKPKPTSSSPATVTKLSNPIKKETTVQKSPELNQRTQCNPSDDLLGLITGPPPTNISPTDPFASPVKVPTADSNNKEDLGSIFTSDAGFDPSQGQKMTKESILSLYGQAPSNNVNPFASQGMFSTSSNPFPQMATPYNSNVMGQGQVQNPYGNIQNDLSVLNGSGAGNNLFSSQPDASQQIQQQMFGLNLANFGPQQGMPTGMPAYGIPNPGLQGNQQGFPQANNPMGFNPLSMPNKGFLPSQTNFPSFPPTAGNLPVLNNTAAGNPNQHIFPNDGPIAATNLWK